MALFCYKCGAEYAEKPKPGFKDTCGKCFAYLYCCRNCADFDAAKDLGCRLTHIETVADPEKFNYCDEFRFREGGSGGGKPAPKKNLLELLGGGEGD